MDNSQLNNMLDNKLKQDILDRLNFAHDSLVVSRQKGKISEEIFVNYFLAFFSGQAYSSNERNYIVEWISIAGSPTAEVDVLDTAGNVLFSVPALYSTNIFSVTSQKGPGIQDIVYEYGLRKAGVPAAANNYLSSAMLAKFSQMTKANEHQFSVEDRWNWIFNKYGIIKLDQVSQAQSTQDDDDVLYE